MNQEKKELKVGDKVSTPMVAVNCETIGKIIHISSKSKTEIGISYPNGGLVYVHSSLVLTHE